MVSGRWGRVKWRGTNEGAPSLRSLQGWENRTHKTRVCGSPPFRTNREKMGHPAWFQQLRCDSTVMVAECSLNQNFSEKGHF
jgi:hypothetical protein